MLDGIARKIGLVIGGVTFLPWLFIVIAFALLTVDIGVAPIGSASFPYWIVSLEGLPLIALSCVHAAISTPRTAKILRAVTTFMSVIFILCLGMLLYLSGNTLVAGLTTVHAINLLFAGSLLATVAWIAQMVVWTFYEEPAMST